MVLTDIQPLRKSALPLYLHGGDVFAEQGQAAAERHVSDY